ncbi:MAG: type II toxin-antitoxin system prevent-host-death family antitoxin [Alphaproteobacteria bacterium]|nr:type II toxin-antitoxin system prevent-host-death family antitoxin [Alphaproteobacteria bacterium]MBT4086437.1 type II toxin-antitoxin system prevent-host-death family antitoxin [Alphaproteobacteria bacterium]MBT4546417.1 type II toxin-antitoxin system prevent-host-death family antitoxin [Alphaproteobacteria bacterium]MBT7747688.1 type II toxin-antitoxin system prevent-host-death family antitoxin [Alphaproteobacteria bacterium]
MPKLQVNMHEAKSQLSRLGERVWHGETVVIARAGKPWLDLTAHKSSPSNRSPGMLKGQIEIGDDFDETPADIISAFDGDV